MGPVNNLLMEYLSDSMCLRESSSCSELLDSLVL